MSMFAAAPRSAPVDGTVDGTVAARGDDPDAARGRLVDLLAGGGVVVLTGAGMSTDSGIPDYRGPDGKRRVTRMTIAEFRGEADNRRRYWARAYVGWDRFNAAVPNPAHRAVTRFQQLGLVGAVITQNVDGLHQRAGSREVTELHGTLAAVVCLSCGRRYARANVQAALAVAHPQFASRAAAAKAAGSLIQPDGDVALPETLVESFRPPRCPGCGSDLMKPDVVFFGESVPKERVQRCFDAVEACRGLFVLGSSLQVMSGLRFVRRARALELPVALVTRGMTRGDDLATIRLDAGLARTLTAVQEALDAVGVCSGSQTA